jgi:hypothetical protein
LPSSFSADGGSVRAGRSWRAAAGAFALAALAAVVTWAVYRDTLHYGFHYDDYSFLHPYPAAEVRRTFTGAWDISGIHVPFYRPLTIAFYAARFDLLGLNAYAHHLLSLILFAHAAALAGIFAWRATASPSAGLLATVFVGVHPAMPYAAVVWGTNQMHLLALNIMLVAVLWWLVVRRRPLVWWMPLLLLAAAAFMVKEDGVMLLPAILALHWLRAMLVERDLRSVRWGFALIAVAWIAGLLALRSLALEQIGGYGVPSAERAWRNVSRGLYNLLTLSPADRPWQPLASWFSIAVMAGGLAVQKWTPRGLRFLIAAGVTITVLFMLPFALVIKAEQLHLVATGASLILAGSAASLLTVSRRPAAKAAVTLALAAGLAAFAAVARDASRDFAPFGPVVSYGDEIVTGWHSVAPELRAYLTMKREPGAAARLSANPVDVLEYVSFGVHSDETAPDGRRYRWMSGPDTEIHVRADARTMTMELRHDRGAFREPAHVEIDANGRRVDAIDLIDSGWRVSRFVMPPFESWRLSRMHRVRIAIDHAWVPSQVIRGSNDGRMLGLQISEIRPR